MDKQRIAKTVSNFQNGSNCAQSVLSNYLPSLGIPETIAHKMGAGLGGGIGGKQMVCGALSAGVMVASAHVGNEEIEDTFQKKLASELARQMVDDFEEKFGSTQCRDLVGADTSTEHGKKMALEANVYREVCDKCVEHIASQLEDILPQKK